MVHGTIKKVAGPLVVAENMQSAKMYDMALVSDKNLIGEIIEIRGDLASIQVYEETGGVAPGEPVQSLDIPMSVELGPGLISTIFDGIQRPLSGLYAKTGDRLDRGVRIPSLDRDKKWDFEASAAVGDEVSAGDVIGTVRETQSVLQKIMIPPGISGKLETIVSGSYTVDETVATVKTADGATAPVSLMQKWPVRKGRPYQRKLNPDIPLVTGQRVIDTLFPLAEGGTAAVPGPFGSGKTVVQHQLAKWANVDIVVYIGCGERGNEMTDVLHEFPKLIDPHTGRSLMERTVLIANTSDMPVAAREASIYTGITIAEYFRDMGYSVALMADSTSRWAEALREISGRLEEMPGEEGYPAYLGSRLAQFYERAGRVISLGKDNREGSLSVIGAVSPPGGDISEPVSQATLRIVKVFWNLDAQLAYARHFPAISWLNSYSLYTADMDDWFNQEISPDWSRKREEVMLLLDEESKLSEIVRLVGMDALSPEERLKMETARSIREDFLHQNSFDPVDTYASLDKQNFMLNFIVEFHRSALKVLRAGGNIADILALQVREKISRFKYLPEEECKTQSSEILSEIKNGMDAITPKGDGSDA